MSPISLFSVRKGTLPAVLTAGGLLLAAAILSACSNAPMIAPAERPLPKETLMLLGKKGMDADAPMFIRVFKEESELELWKARDDGRFYHFKTYPICNWSGDLGPKVQQGDKQAPEGFYAIAQNQMNPNSGFHLAFNLGYPNAYDKANRRTGDFLMVHGKCRSAGCYAMTDALMEEIYALARESFKGGQQAFQVHAYPFRMTDTNMARHKGHKWHPFWATLKEGYDHFEATRVPPSVAVCERKYVVNVRLPQSRIDPEGACPAFERPQLDPFKLKPQQVAEERVVVPGPKMRGLANADAGEGPQSGMAADAVFGLGAGTASRMSAPPKVGFGLN